MTPQVSTAIVCLGGLLIAYALCAVGDALLLRRFLASSNAAITLYEEYFKEVLGKKFSVSKEKAYIVSWEGYEFKFTNNKEASCQYENLLKEALADYEELNEDTRYELREERRKLMQIYSEIRMLRWKMQ